MPAMDNQAFGLQTGPALLRPPGGLASWSPLTLSMLVTRVRPLPSRRTEGAWFSPASTAFLQCRLGTASRTESRTGQTAPCHPEDDGALNVQRRERTRDVIFRSPDKRRS